MSTLDLALLKELEGLRKRAGLLKTSAASSAFFLVTMQIVSLVYLLVGVLEAPSMGLNDIHVPFDVSSEAYHPYQSVFSEALFGVLRFFPMIIFPVAIIWGVCSLIRGDLSLGSIFTAVSAFAMVAIFNGLGYTHTAQTPLEKALQEGQLENLEPILTRYEGISEPLKTYLLGQSAVRSGELNSPWLERAFKLIQDGGLGEDVEVPGQVAYAIGASLHGADSDQLPAIALIYRDEALSAQADWVRRSRHVSLLAAGAAAVTAVFFLTWLILRRRLDTIRDLMDALKLQNSKKSS